jgi:hypothetical protein
MRLDASDGPHYRLAVSQDRTSGERMAGPIASTTESALHTENVRTSLQLAFFAICLSLAQAAFMVAFRTGLPTPILSYTIGPAILICTVLGPILWASRAPGRAKWIGRSQAGKSLVDARWPTRRKPATRAAAYLATQSDYWPLISDCDGKVTYPMSLAGVPVIDGYPPVQSTCLQQFSLRGYGGWGAAPETRSDIGDQELCSRVRQEGSGVLRIESLADRSRDRKISCP